MEDKLKAFLHQIQGQLTEAIAMCGGEEEAEEEEAPMVDGTAEEGAPMESSLRKEKLKLRLKKEFGA